MEPTISPFDSQDDPSDLQDHTPGAVFGANVHAAPELGAPHALQALEAGLSLSIEGLTILDRELAFDGLGRIDFAGIDAEGRLVLILLLDDDADKASLESLDLAVIAEDHRGLIARHLGVPDKSECGAARCVLVAESIDSRLNKRLALLRGSFEMFELQSLASERGSQTYLVPARCVESEGASSKAPEVEEVSAEEFLVDLNTASRDAAEVLLARMHRMDSEFSVIFTATGGRWAFNGRELLCVERKSEGLIGRVLPAGRPVILDDVSAVEGIVEEAFSAYVLLLGLFDDIEDAYPVPAPSSEPLLSAEEIAAFQD